MKKILTKHVDDPFLLWLAGVIIDNDCTANCLYRGRRELLKKVPAHKTLFGKHGCGMPIGNLTSQFFANLYLNELDQFIKHQLRCRHYIRYMDDMILLSASADELRQWMLDIDRFLNRELNLALHPHKRTILPIGNGVDFLGYVVRPFYTLVRRRVIGNLKWKVRQGLVDEQVWSSYRGHFEHAQSRRLEKKLLIFLRQHGLEFTVETA